VLRCHDINAAEKEAGMPVSHILGVKGRNVITVRPTDTVETVAKILGEKRIGAVVVVDDLSRIEGIVSERDVVRQIANEGAGVLKKTAADIMTKDVQTCREGDSEQDLMAMMTSRRIRHLPVAKNGKLAGMISIGDVVKFRIEAIEREAEDMKAYIAGAA
jgi:CBS domain-containing protein